MLLNNNDIYTIAINLQKFLADKENLPIKLAFYFLKNKNLIVEKAKEVNELKEKIGAKYGTLNEETGVYTISQENLESAQMELNELLSIEQDLPIYKVKLQDFPDNFNLDFKQMEDIAFMIEE